MKSTVLKYGIYALISSCILFLSGFFLIEDGDFGNMAIYGFSTIFISLLFVFFGIKHFRDKVNNGLLSLGRAIKIGVLISLFAAMGIAVADYIYSSSINPDFVTEYKEYTLNQYQEANLSVAEITEKTEELEASMAMMDSSFKMALFMFIEVTIFGFIISLITGLILQRKN